MLKQDDAPAKWCQGEHYLHVERRVLALKHFNDHWVQIDDIYSSTVQVDRVQYAIFCVSTVKGANNRPVLFHFIGRNWLIFIGGQKENGRVRMGRI